MITWVNHFALLLVPVLLVIFTLQRAGLKIRQRIKMSLGLCCQWIEQRKNRNGKIITENILDEKSLQLGAYQNGKYSRERILETYRGNVKEIMRIIPRLNEHNIKSFRLSSSLFPLFEFCGDIVRNDEQIKTNLAIAGRLFQESGIRVTTHPGQFCVISSDRDKVVENSINELAYHAFIFDAMGFPATPYYAINIHGGKAKRSERIIEVFKTLPDNIKKRLTLENDEKCYNVRQLIDISSRTGIPIVLDSHHYTFGDGDLEFIDAFRESANTWSGIKPLQHISNTEIGCENAAYNKKRAHSQLIRYAPEIQLNAMRDNTVDVDVEAKLKNIALIKMRKDFKIDV
jgi:UV DNA damage endonuclease